MLDRFVRRIHLSLRQKAPGFDTEKIGPGGAFLLLTLDEMGPVPMHALTQTLLRDKSQLTREVRALECKGLVAREQSPTDSRVSIVSLTEKGDVIVRVHQRVIAATIDEMLAPLDADGQDELSALLRRALTQSPLR